MKTRYNRKTSNTIKKTKNKTLKGGISFSFNRTPKTTTEVLTDFHKKIGNIKIKDIEPNFLTNIDKLRERKGECIPKCLAAGEDELTRKQMKSMIESKSFYEWGNVCGNGFNIKKCKEFLHSYKKLDTYSKYIQVLNDNIQHHFDNITEELNKNINKNDNSALLRAAFIKSKSSSQSQKSQNSQRSRKSKSSSNKSNSVFSPLSNSSDYSFKSTNSRLSAL